MTIPADVPADHAARMAASRQLFREKVAPALRKHCLKCHGGAGGVKGDFDLSTRETLLASGMVEKRGADSHLLAVLRHEAEPYMPLKADRLPAQTIQQVSRWIDLGAAYDKPLAGPSVKGELQVTETDRQFWSFRPLAPATAPPLDDSWARTDLDRFILSKLRGRGLKPNADADRRTLIRRATFDLWGLPPAPGEVAAFVADPDPKAYEKLIDRLLDSPHYGERWARHWMDVARFAESHGYEQDYDRKHAYHYRDFLIRALNDDLPFDTFVHWQLAGDELAPDDPLALMATGFLGAGAFPTQLTEAEFESARYDELDDMTTTTGVAFLGLSVGCARCHDHKYDPIPSRDYYRLAATFTKTIRSEIEVETTAAANRLRRERHAERLAELAAEEAAYAGERLDKDFQAWLDALDVKTLSSPASGAPATAGQWIALPVAASSTAATVFQPLPDGTLLSTGEAPAKETITLTAVDSVVLQGIRAVRLEALTHPSLPRGGPGRAGNGNFALGHIALQVVGADGRAAGEVKLTAARATHQQNASSLSVAASIDDDPVSGWAVDQGGIGKDQAAVFDAEKAFSVAAGQRLQIVLTFEHPNQRHTIGRLRVSLGRQTQAAAEVGPPGWPAQRIAELRAAKKDGPQAASWRRARDWYRDRHSPLAELRRQRSALEAAGPKIEKSLVQVTGEGFPHMKHHADGRGYPHFYQRTFYLERGDVHQKQEPIAPGVLQVLARSPADAAGDSANRPRWQIEAPEDWSRSSFARARLALWLTDVEQGAGSLVARVAVNRLWHHHFGRGIVATPNDFGLQGERPTHPVLLDHLARQLVAGGWKLKPLHRQIMLSSVYRQSSEGDEVRAAADPDNLLWWRREPRRLEAEAIRDSLLAVSGRLDTTMYGPGTLDERMRRRSVYFFIKRSKLIRGMMLFDWPEHLVSIGRRATTTIAPQALAFMNSPQGRESAAALAANCRSAGSGEPWVRRVYEAALMRAPEDRELTLGLEFLKRQSAAYRMAQRQNPQQIAETDFCQAVLSMNEFIYVD